MSEKVTRMFRRQADEAAKRVAGEIAPGVNAALQNEQLTRARVEELEARVWSLETALTSFAAMSRWKRLKWLFSRPIRKA